MVWRRRRPGHRRNCRADFGVAVAAMREENSTGLAGLRRGRPGRPEPPRRPALAWRLRTRRIQPRTAGCEALRTADFPRDLLDVRPGDEAAVDEIELEDRLSLPDLLEGLGELERQAVVMRFF
jgi:hypothetical protein